MGCLCAKDLIKEDPLSEAVSKKTYSWDAKRKSLQEFQNFIVENLENKEDVRKPGSVDGQQFIIQNCKDSTIYVFDYINTVTIDDCINCKIILGPIQGSAFIRNCKSCTCVIACGQFRMRDSNKINVFLFCATQPIIEASKDIHFGSYQLKYNYIDEHFQKTNLRSANKNWKFIYDFTPVEYEDNWRLLKNIKVSDYIKEPKTDEIKKELDKLGHVWTNFGM